MSDEWVDNGADGWKLGALGLIEGLEMDGLAAPATEVESIDNCAAAVALDKGTGGFRGEVRTSRLGAEGCGEDGTSAVFATTGCLAEAPSSTFLIPDLLAIFPRLDCLLMLDGLGEAVRSGTYGTVMEPKGARGAASSSFADGAFGFALALVT